MSGRVSPPTYSKGNAMHMQDRLTIDTKRRTADGYLTVNARVARAGNVQLYSGAEVGKLDMQTVRVFRPEDEVFSKDTMQSFAHRPVTLGHPNKPVTAINWRDVAKGWSDGEVARDGEFIRVSMLLADADAIKAIEDGTRELSMGYDCSLDWTSGVSPSGEAYDAVQRGIRSNHIAVVPQARGGAELRIGDSASGDRKELHMMTDGEKQTMRDSVRTMTVTQAATLPLYDGVRGCVAGGMAADRYYAIVDGAQPDPISEGQARAQAAYDQMVSDLSSSRDRDHDAADRPQFARDGRPLAQLADHERSYEEMIIRQSNAWKGS